MLTACDEPGDAKLLNWARALATRQAENSRIANKAAKARLER
jgi:hypothetical protein